MPLGSLDRSCANCQRVNSNFSCLMDFSVMNLNLSGFFCFLDIGDNESDLFGVDRHPFGCRSFFQGWLVSLVRQWEYASVSLKRKHVPCKSTCFLLRFYSLYPSSSIQKSTNTHFSLVGCRYVLIKVFTLCPV
jgi:hypothetical protein